MPKSDRCVSRPAVRVHVLHAALFSNRAISRGCRASGLYQLHGASAGAATPTFFQKSRRFLFEGSCLFPAALCPGISPTGLSLVAAGSKHGPSKGPLGAAPLVRAKRYRGVPARRPSWTCWNALRHRRPNPLGGQSRGRPPSSVPSFERTSLGSQVNPRSQRLSLRRVRYEVWRQS